MLYKTLKYWFSIRRNTIGNSKKLLYYINSILTIRILSSQKAKNVINKLLKSLFLFKGQ